MLPIAHVCRLVRPLAVLAAAFALQGPPASAAPPSGEARVIVKLKREHVGSTASRQAPTVAQATAEAARDAERLHHVAARRAPGLRVQRALAEGTRLVTASGMTSAALAARLAADPDVAYAEPDRRVLPHAVPNDPRYASGGADGPAVGQWYLKPPNSIEYAAIDAEGAWDLTTGSASIVVAVLDSGVRAEHPDLAGKLVAGYDFVGYASNASDAATIANDGDLDDSDPSDPGDWVSQADKDADPALYGGCSVSDSSWHGTQVAALIGAQTNNGTGMAGVSWGSPLLSVRVLGKCFGYVSDIVAGMRWAAGLTVPGVPANANPARIINLSLGTSGDCGSSFADAIDDVRARGAVVVASAGNEGGRVAAPANCAGVIAVAGVRHIGTKVGYSDLGPEISISAPAGNCVNDSGACLYPLLTASDTGTTVPAGSTYTGGGTSPTIGTSFSAPLVSGTAALVLSVRPDLTPTQVRTVIERSAFPFPQSGATPGTPQCSSAGSVQDFECYCTESTCGAGLLDARAAVEEAVAFSADADDDGGGGGGGGLGLGYLLGLAAAVAWTRRVCTPPH